MNQAICEWFRQQVRLFVLMISGETPRFTSVAPKLHVHNGDESAACETRLPSIKKRGDGSSDPVQVVPCSAAEFFGFYRIQE